MELCQLSLNEERELGRLKVSQKRQILNLFQRLILGELQSIPMIPQLSVEDLWLGSDRTACYASDFFSMIRLMSPYSLAWFAVIQ